jgi:hypothetical protein
MIAAQVRYKRENPGPGVRVSAFLERRGAELKIRHLQQSKLMRSTTSAIPTAMTKEILGLRKVCL